MPRDFSPEEVAELMEAAEEAEAEQRRQRIISGDLPEGEDCPYCGEVVDRNNLHLVCF